MTDKEKFDKLKQIVVFVVIWIMSIVSVSYASHSMMSTKVRSQKQFINGDATYKCQMTNQLKENYLEKKNVRKK